jgi:hypothetical protein
MPEADIASTTEPTFESFPKISFGWVKLVTTSCVAISKLSSSSRQKGFLYPRSRLNRKGATWMFEWGWQRSEYPPRHCPQLMYPLPEAEVKPWGQSHHYGRQGQWEMKPQMSPRKRGTWKCVCIRWISSLWPSDLAKSSPFQLKLLALICLSCRSGENLELGKSTSWLPML